MGWLSYAGGSPNACDKKLHCNFLGTPLQNLIKPMQKYVQSKINTLLYTAEGLIFILRGRDSHRSPGNKVIAFSLKILYIIFSKKKIRRIQSR